MTNIPPFQPQPINHDTSPASSAGARFAVRVINVGESLNRNVYPADVLRAALPLFDGVRVFVKSDAEHLSSMGGRDVRNLIGRIVGPKYVPPADGQPGGIEGIFEAIDPDDPTVRRMAEAVRRGMNNLFGLSILAHIEGEDRREGGTIKRVAKRFIEVKSVDVVTTPAAGGAVIGLAESVGESPMNALSPLEIGRRIERCALSSLSKDRLIGELGEGEVTEVRWTEAVNEAMRLEREIANEISHAGKVHGLGVSTRVIEAEEDKKARMLDALFDPGDSSVRSIRNCYVDITGDREITGRAPRPMRVSEALTSTSFPDLLGDAMQRRMLADYRTPGIYDVWRDLANIVPVGDFRDQHRVRYGGYGDLPIVAESTAYPAVDSPTDEEAVYRVRKRGGIETVTLETIKNDDVGAVLQVPIRMSRAAKRTLAKFVLDFLRLNAPIYDGTPLFHVSHGNLGTAALSAAAIADARIAMKAQKEKNTLEALGIPPRFLWVPDTLEQAAFDLFRLGTNNEANFIQSLQWQIRPVWYWSDTSDWCLSADKADIPSVEIGFLDGQEEPQIFIQDDPRSGQMFTHDVITYKIRHIYGGAVTDFRGLYKSVVAQ